MTKHEIILKSSQKILNKHGFSPIILNILEHEEVFKRTLGENSEIISKVIYFLLMQIILSVKIGDVYFEGFIR